ncbi:hypothetical protein VNO78_17449 [Psophocarpus tetragonolobus]|uniref:Uncharacterized protein n=1 Tax=Psophocarpus tetragonolobus TaxID=3891 RepID=A0AAN9SJ16_PSOTE
MNGSRGSVGGGATEKVAERKKATESDAAAVREPQWCRYRTMTAQVGNGDFGCLKTLSFFKTLAVRVWKERKSEKATKMNGGGGSVGGGATKKVAGRRSGLVVVGFVSPKGDLVVIRKLRWCRYRTRGAQVGNGDSGCLKTRGEGSVGGGAPEKGRSGTGCCWVSMAKRISGGCTGTAAM